MYKSKALLEHEIKIISQQIRNYEYHLTQISHGIEFNRTCRLLDTLTAQWKKLLLEMKGY